MKPWQKILFALFCVVAVIYFLMMGIRLYIEKKIMSRLGAEGKIQYEDWRTRKLSFAPEDIEAMPFQEKTLEAAERFYKIWDEKKEDARNLEQKYKMYKTKMSEKNDQDTSTTSSQSLAKEREYRNIEDFYEELPPFESLITAFEEMVNQPDYEIDVITAEGDPWGMAYTGRQDYFLSLQVLSRILEIKTSSLLSEGRTAEAFAAAETIIRASKSHPFSTLLHRLIGITILSNGSRAWHEIVAQCSDAILLRETLKQQLALKPKKDLIPEDGLVQVSDAIGQIRSAKRRGIETSIQGMTGREILGESMRVEAEFLEKFSLPKITDQKQKENIQEMINNMKTSSSLFGGKPRNLWAFGAKAVSSIASPILYNIARPNFLEAKTREKFSRARYDLLILSTAGKIYTLEHGAEPEKPEDLTPGLLPEIPGDPFAQDGKSYMSKPRLYSVGPDSIDQEATVLYDPTNGTVSSGDIFGGE